ncbi:chemotaxis protein CheW [bacterium]|nr:MAG: chemotaxis protein CheW [bacterium]
MAEIDLVVFKIKTELYSLDISFVKEVVELRPIVPVPETPEFILGVINLRGEVLPVIDIKKRLGFGNVHAEINSKIIIVENDRYKAGLLVESLPYVIHSDTEKIKPEPTTIQPKVDMDLVSGVIEEDFLVVLDIDRILTRSGQ